METPPPPPLPPLLRLRLSPGPGNDRVMGAVEGGLDAGGGGGGIAAADVDEDKAFALDLSLEAEVAFCKFKVEDLESTSRSGTVTSRPGVREDRSTDGRRLLTLPALPD